MHTEIHNLLCQTKIMSELGLALLTKRWSLSCINFIFSPALIFIPNLNKKNKRIWLHYRNLFPDIYICKESYVPFCVFFFYYRSWTAVSIRISQVLSCAEKIRFYIHPALQKALMIYYLMSYSPILVIHIIAWL